MSIELNGNKTVKLFYLILTAIAIAACDSRYQDSTYNNFEEAKKSGVTEKGWIPDFLPKSAHGIREQHCIDTNEVWVTFKFSEEDFHKITLNLIKQNYAEVVMPYRHPFWWVKSFDGYEFYLHNDVQEPGILAINKHSLQVYYWSVLGNPTKPAK